LALQDLNAFWPELILFIFGVAVLIVDIVATRVRRGDFGVGVVSQPRYVPWLPYLALAGLALALLAAALMPLSGEIIFAGMLAADGLAFFFKLVVTLAVGLVVLSSIDYMKGHPDAGPFYALLLFAALAISLAAAASNLLLIYLAIEFLSLTSYVLVGFLQGNAKSSEAALKYFLFGAVASATMLYGISLLYGATGSLDLADIAAFFHRTGAEPNRLLAFVAIVLSLAGFGFKIVAVPFHQWAPDAYEGAPTPITAFLSVASKAAGFAVLIRVLMVALPTFQVDWVLLLAIIAAVSMTLGNLTAIPQKNIKRMLAYSSIAQAGYILIGLAALGGGRGEVFGDGLSGSLIYILGYLFTNLGAFLVVIAIEQSTGSVEIKDYAGMGRRAPFLAIALVIFFLSLVGFPTTAGFIGKLFVFYAAIKSQLLWLAALGVLNSVISVYYYFNVVRQMYFEPAPAEAPAVADTFALRAALVFSLIMLFVIGLFPQPFLDVVRTSSQLLAML